MKQVCDFIRSCGAFFVLTVNGDYPAGRPFGAIMEREGRLYIATDSSKDVCHQLRTHPQMQLVALKPGARQWIRISAVACECEDAGKKQEMLEECPVLKKYFDSADAPGYAMFELDVRQVQMINN